MIRTFVKRKYNPSIRDFLEYISCNPHENFPVIAEVCDDFYVMEHIEGENLSNVIKQKPLAPDKAKNYILQLLNAVEVLHSFRIVHRDIKPENIIIMPDGVLKLIDFDISRKVVYNKSADTSLLGTAGYAAPEQYGFTQTDERSDIYAIGVIYNYMITGKFPAERMADGQFGKIIKKCTEIDSKNRYKNISLLRHDILKERFTSYKLLNIIPGFRTRNIYKMILAVFCYVVFFVGYFALAYEEGPRENISDIIMFYIIFSIIIAYNFVFFALITNFFGFTDRIKFPVKNKISKTIFLSIIWYLFGLFISAAVLESFTEGLLYNPINVTFMLFGYFLYSIVESFLIGMQ